MCERRVDLHSLARLLDAALLRQGCQGSHVVQAVGKLDEDDPDVLGHGYEHFAQIVTLRLGHRLELDLPQFRHTVDELRDLVTEALANLFDRGFGVFDSVVQQRGFKGGGVHVEFGENQRDLDRVIDERLTALAHLTLVREMCEVIRLVESGQIGVGIVRKDLCFDLFERC